MAGFPENEIQVFREYVSEDLAELMGGIAEALDRASITITGALMGPNAQLAGRIISDRSLVRGILTHASSAATLEALAEIEGLMLVARNFDGALDSLDGLEDVSRVARITSFGEAFHATAVSFRESFSNPNGGPVFSVPRTLPGYGGPRPSSAESNRIFAWDSFLSHDAERRFRLTLLRAEILVGQRKFERAAAEYQRILDAPDVPDANHRKFVALRKGAAQLALGDVHFRASRRLSATQKQDARAAYEGAIAVVEGEAASPANPVHARVVGTARNRLAMLDAGINALGLRDSFVPVQRHQFLLSLTEDHITAARDAVAKFVAYQQKGDDLEAAEQQTEFELEVALKGVEIATDRADIADLQSTRVGIQIEEIERQQSPFAIENFGRLFEFASQVSSMKDPSTATQVFGAAAAVANHMARQNELEFQHRLAEVDRDIAAVEAQIAGLEVEIANRRVEFLEDRLAFGSGRLDKDLFYALARVYEELAERQVEAAIRFAYLFERAMAFFLGQPDIAHIQLDYRTPSGELAGQDASGALITAPDLLNEDLGDVKAEPANIPETDVRRAFTEPAFSLAREFPLEFSRMIQTPPGETARMDFVVSFHQLSKRRPDCHQVRIIKVVVRIPSVSAADDFAGTLTHWGRFLVRDKESTLAPTTVRLVPTPAEVEAALRRQQEEGLPQAAIGGIIPYALAVAPVPFGAPSDATSQFTEFTLGAFEGYGPAGPWQLELRNVNVRVLSDVTLTFDLEAATDATDLEERVDPLIDAYEQELADQFVDGETLDRMHVFSLRRQFPGDFAELATGAASVELTAAHFSGPATDGEDTRVRTVVAQALDGEGVGVESIALAIGKPGTDFTLTRTTVAGGFSEDLTVGRPPIVPPEARPLGPGTWEVRLTEGQFDALEDLVLFFVCDFR